MANPSLASIVHLKEWFFNTAQNPVWKLYKGERITENSQMLAQHPSDNLEASWDMLIRNILMFRKGKYSLETRKNARNAANKMTVTVDLEDFNFNKFRANNPQYNQHTNNQNFNYNLGDPYQNNPYGYPPQYPTPYPPQYPPQNNTINELAMTILTNQLSGTTNQSLNDNRFSTEVQNFIDKEVEKREKAIEQRYKDKYDIELKMKHSHYQNLFNAAMLKLQANPNVNLANAFSNALNKDGFIGIASVLQGLKSGKKT